MVYAAGEERESSFRTGGREPVSLYQVMGGGGNEDFKNLFQ